MSVSADTLSALLRCIAAEDCLSIQWRADLAQLAYEIEREACLADHRTGNQVVMQQRRRKIASGESEMGEERWSGDPNEEPKKPAEAAADTAAAGEPTAKDRHPMPWGLVIHDVYGLDVHKTFKRLTEQLTLGDAASEYGTVLKAVDEAARNLFDAVRLARKAKNEDAEFALKLDQREEVLRSAAQRDLEDEKAKGFRSKAPTIKDIDDRMLSSWPDEVVSIRARKAEMHGAYRAIEELVDVWKKRCSHVEVLANRFRASGTT